MENISKNITYAEAIHSQTAKRKCIDNTPNPTQVENMKVLAEKIQIPIIASGGVGNLQHLVDGVIEGKADAVLAASIFHFAEYSISEAKEFMRDAGIEMRL